MADVLGIDVEDGCGGEEWTKAVEECVKPQTVKE